MQNIRFPGVLHHFSLRPNTSDWAVFRQIFLEEEYAVDITKPPDIIIDAGANIGLFTIYIKTRFPKARVICLEPDPDNFIQLEKNLRPYNDVECLQAGLWNCNTRLRVLDKYNMGKWAMAVEPTTDHRGIESLDMDTLMKRFNLNRLDVVKIDIEGSEKAVFAHNYERWLERTDMIIIELHDHFIQGCARTFFSATNECWPNYDYSTKGENTVVKCVRDQDRLRP